MVELIPPQQRAQVYSLRQFVKESLPLRQNWRTSVSVLWTNMYSTSHSARCYNHRSFPWRSRTPSWNGNFKSSRNCPPPSAPRESRGWRQQKSNCQVSFDTTTTTTVTTADERVSHHTREPATHPATHPPPKAPSTLEGFSLFAHNPSALSGELGRAAQRMISVPH